MRLAVFTLVGIILCFQHASANNFRQRNYIRTLSSQQPQQQQQQQQQQPQQPQLRAGVVSMMMPMMGSSDSYGQQQQQQQQLQTQFPVSQKNSYSSSGEQQTQQQKQVSLAVADARSDEIESKLQERNEPVINEQKVKETIENAFSSRIITKPAQQTQIEPRITVTPAPVRSSFVNPCTAEVLRMSDIMLFRDPTDKRSYLICTDIDVFHSMPCPEGTIFNDDLHHCVPEGYEAPKCPESFCKNDADCLVDETNTFKCICKVGFTGQFCETNIDECALGGAQACAGGTCVDQINGYYCIFRNGMIGLREENAIANPCTVDNFAREAYLFEVPSVNGDVWLQCVGESQFVVSKCAEHLFWNSELQTCTIERPLAKSGVCRTLPCKNGGECQDLGNSQFQCQCRPGFTGEVCENVIDLCLSNPCANGGRCLSWTGGYTCVCQNKIIDETCTSGLNNPCPPRANLIPGFNDYFAHPSPNRYFHCDIDGRAFARTCMTGLRWKQEALSCLPESFVLESVVPKAMPPQKNRPTFVPNPIVSSVSTKGSFSTIGTQGIPQLAPVSASGSSSSSSGYGYAQQRVEVPSFEVAVPEQVPVTQPTPVVTLPPVTQPPVTQEPVRSSGYGGYGQSEMADSQQQQEESTDLQQSESEVLQTEVEPQLELDIPVELESVPMSGKDLVSNQGIQGKQQMFDQFNGVQQPSGRVMNFDQINGMQQGTQQNGRKQMFDQFNGMQQQRNTQGQLQMNQQLSQDQINGIQQGSQQQRNGQLSQDQFNGMQQQRNLQGQLQLNQQLNQDQINGMQQGSQQQRNTQGQLQMNQQLSQDQVRGIQQGSQQGVQQQRNLQGQLQLSQDQINGMQQQRNTQQLNQDQIQQGSQQRNVQGQLQLNQQLSQDQFNGMQQGIQQQRNVQGQLQMNPQLSQDQLRSLQQAQRMIGQQNNLFLDQNTQQQQQQVPTQRLTGSTSQQTQTSSSLHKQSFNQDLVNQQNTLQSQFRSFGNQQQQQPTQQQTQPQQSRLTNSQLLRIRNRIQN